MTMLGLFSREKRRLQRDLRKTFHCLKGATRELEIDFLSLVLVMIISR